MPGKHRWMLAGALGGVALWPSDPSLAGEAPAKPPPSPPPQQDLDPDLAILRRHLRRASSCVAEVPAAVGEALDRLAERDPKRAQVWRTVRAFLDGTAAADQRRRVNLPKTRMMIQPGQEALRSLGQWEIRAAALMDLARSGRLAEDVYQEAHRSLEEALRKGLAEIDPKPYPRTVDEAARLLLELLEPELRDLKTLPSPLREEVGRLVGELGDREWKVREAASQRLLAIGEPALGALREALGGRDKEVEARARDLWERILAGEEPPKAAAPEKP